MKIKPSVVLFGLAGLLFAASCNKKSMRTKTENLSSQVVLQWNEGAFEAMGGAAYQHSLLASRINAMVHIAMHDALNAVNPVYEQYAYKKKVPFADAVTAAANAAYTVLEASFPEKKPMLDSLLFVSLAVVPEGSAKSEGISLGIEAAQAILMLRSGDNAEAAPISFIDPSTVPGVYNVVPPFNFLFAPHWKTMKLFALEKQDQFRSIPPPALNSVAYANGFREVKEIGVANSKIRTTDQTAYAKFWYEFSEIGWNRVALTVAKDRKTRLMESARLFALLNMVLADSYTAGWDAKFHYNFWRPYTAIHAAGTDLNYETFADNAWESLQPAPPVQDYPSTHSALGNGAAEVLSFIFSNSTPFTITSFTAFPVGTARSFNSFSQAANENADSRVMAGIHFRSSCVAGQKLGDDVGKYIVQKYLKPLN